MSTAAKITTAEELFAMPEDGSRYELVAGELKMMTPAGSEHGVISMELSMRLAYHVRQNDLGLVFCAETGFLVSRDPDTVLAPDAAFVRKSRLEETGIPKSFFPEAPALVVEVASPRDTIDEVELKIRRWLASGVEMAWVVNPTGRTVTVYRSTENIRILTENDPLEGEDVVPGFSCLVADIFGSR